MIIDNDVRAFRSTMTEAAELIFNLYIADHADFQVNIPSRGTAKIASQLIAPHACMFDDAQTEVKRLLVLNSFPRFFESDICIDMMVHTYILYTIMRRQPPMYNDAMLEIG